MTNTSIADTLLSAQKSNNVSLELLTNSYNNIMCDAESILTEVNRNYYNNENIYQKIKSFQMNLFRFNMVNKNFTNDYTNNLRALFNSIKDIIINNNFFHDTSKFLLTDCDYMRNNMPIPAWMTE